MRLAVLSDIHGNLPALEAVLTDLRPLNVDHVIVAGDSINWGPFSHEVIDHIANRNWAVIRGNHELYLLEQGRDEEPQYRRGWTTKRHLRETIPENLQYYIGSLPDSLTLYYPGLPSIAVFHASPGDHFRGVFIQMSDEEINAIFEHVSARTIIVGHTHLPMHKEIGKRQILNPGSVGVALDGIHGARYMLLDSDADGWTPTFRHVEYDYKPLFDAFEARQFVDYHQATGRILIEEFRTARPVMWGFRQWLAENGHPMSSESLTLAEQYITDPDARWHYMPESYRLNLPAERIGFWSA